MSNLAIIICLHLRFKKQFRKGQRHHALSSLMEEQRCPLIGGCRSRISILFFLFLFFRFCHLCVVAHESPLNLVKSVNSQPRWKHKKHEALKQTRGMITIVCGKTYACFKPVDQNRSSRCLNEQHGQNGPTYTTKYYNTHRQSDIHQQNGFC